MSFYSEMDHLKHMGKSYVSKYSMNFNTFDSRSFKQKSISPEFFMPQRIKPSVTRNGLITPTSRKLKKFRFPSGIFFIRFALYGMFVNTWRVKRKTVLYSKTLTLL